MTKRAVHIDASLLAADFGCLAKEACRAEKGGADSIHLDIMDGHYVHNLTFGLDLIPVLKRVTSLPLISHLEIDNPDDFVEDLARLGSDLIIVQEDTCPDVGATLDRIRRHGARGGLGVNPDRPVEPLREFMPDLDLLLIMSVWPGFGGQDFQAEVLGKVTMARQWRRESGLQTRIGLDGGITEKTIGRALGAGADYLVIGSAIYGQGDPIEAIPHLRRLIEDHLSAEGAADL